MRDIKQHNKPFSPATEEFLDSIAPFSEKCPQLQVFLHREREGKCPTDTEFLMITSNTFGKVEVLDISVEGPDNREAYDAIINTKVDPPSCRMILAIT